MSYQDQILEDIRQITGCSHLCKQDLYAVIHDLIDRGGLRTIKPQKYISKKTYCDLRDFLLDADKFVSGISVFKDYLKKVQEYRYKNSRAYKDAVQKESDRIDKECRYNPEEDMSAMSRELLKNDDVFYEMKMNKNKKALYESMMKSISKIVKKQINEAYTRDGHETYEMTVSDCSALVISDPCYVLQDDVYEYDFLTLDNANGVIGDAIGLVHGTYYGDDEYDSESGMTYGVDAGTLGIYDAKYCKPKYQSESVREIEVDPNEEHEVELEYDAGTFYFSIDGEVIEEIYTAPEEDEEDDEEYEDYYEDNDEYEEEY